MPSLDLQKKSNPENPATLENLHSETAVVRILQEDSNTPYPSSLPPIRSHKVLWAFLCWLQNVFHNVFYYIKIMDIFSIRSKLNDIYPNLSYLTILLIMLFVSANTVTFATSVLPAVTERSSHQNSKVSNIIDLIQDMLSTDTEYRPSEEVEYQVYVYLNKFRMQKDYGLSNEAFAAVKEKIEETALEKVKIILLTSTQELLDLPVRDSLSPPKPNLLYYHPITSSQAAHLEQFHLIDLESTQSTWLLGLTFIAIPTLNSFLAAFLAGNHTAERFFGDSKNWNYCALLIAQLGFLLLSGTKSYVNLMRKFFKGFGSWKRFLYYMQYCQGKFRIKWSELVLFMRTCGLPLPCSLTTYLSSTFFFYRMGCIDQGHETICQVSKACDFHFDSTAIQPEVPSWEIRVGIFMMMINTLTALFTLGETGLTQFKSERSKTPIAEVTHKKAWIFVLGANCIDAFSQALIFWIGIATAIAHFSGCDITDLKAILPAALIGVFAAYSYLLFQKVFGKKKFDETCENFTSLGGWIKNSLWSLSTYCQGTPHQEKPKNNSAKPLLENGMMHNSYESTTEEAPKIKTRKPRETCLVM